MNVTAPDILTGEFAPPARTVPRTLRVVDWNIDRGLDLPGILSFLSGAEADLLLLQELDLNARRTHRVNVAEEIARKLKLNYVWAREFQELLQGSPDSPAYHGQATLSRFKLSRPRAIRFRSQSHFWQPHWFVPHAYPFQVRVGGRICLAAELGNLVTYNLHLESRNTDNLRDAQLNEILADSSKLNARTPVLMAGDFNMNVNHPKPASALQQAGFSGVLKPRPGPTTHVAFLAGPAIDWAFLRGPVQASAQKVHTNIRASDHFPISFTLNFQ